MQYDDNPPAQEHCHVTTDKLLTASRRGSYDSNDLRSKKHFSAIFSIIKAMLFYIKFISVLTFEEYLKGFKFISHSLSQKYYSLNNLNDLNTF